MAAEPMPTCMRMAGVLRSYYGDVLLKADEDILKFERMFQFLRGCTGILHLSTGCCCCCVQLAVQPLVTTYGCATQEFSLAVP